MPNKNKRIGTAFESRFIANIVKNGAVKAGRFYSSKGITDVWWVDEKGHHNEAQLKFSSITAPYISPAEIQKLKIFATEMDGKILVWLVKKQSHKPIIMERVFWCMNIWLGIVMRMDIQK